MAGIDEQYAKEIRKELGYLATWTPGTPLQLGDVGVFEDGVFVPQSSLESFGLPFDERRADRAVDFDYSSKDGVDIAFNADVATAGATGPIADAKGEVTVKFKRERAVVFNVLGSLEHRISDIIAIQDEILKRHQAGLWRDEWAVVSHLHEAASATILIADSKNSEMGFAVTGDVAPGGVQLANASLGLKLTKVSAVSNRWIAARGLTPIFRAIGIKRNFWGVGRVGVLQRRPPVAERLAGVAGDAELDDRFGYVDYKREA